MFSKNISKDSLFEVMNSAGAGQGAFYFYFRFCPGYMNLKVKHHRKNYGGKPNPLTTSAEIPGFENGFQ